MARDEYVVTSSYHAQMHRAYRAVRARVAQRLSPLSPKFAETVLSEFRQVVAVLELVPPAGGGPRGLPAARD